MDFDGLACGWQGSGAEAAEAASDAGSEASDGGPADDQDREEQLAELEALEAILGEDLFVTSREPAEFSIRVFLELPQEVILLAEEAGGASSSAGPAAATAAAAAAAAGSSALRRAEAALEGQAAAEARSAGEGSVSVAHLPPLQLGVRFRRGYPSSRPAALTLTSEWLPRSSLEDLCKHLDKEYQEGVAVVYSWVLWLQTSALEVLGLAGGGPLALATDGPGRGGRARSWLQDPSEVLRELLDYDQARRREIWSKATHRCGVCFDDKPGSAFMDFGRCGHRFCGACVEAMLQVHVGGGQVTDICCPHVGCREAIAPSTVEELLDEAAFAKWRRLQLKAILQRMDSVVFCPRCERDGLESPVLPQPGDEVLGSELAQCDACRYCFCPKCRDPYHPTQDCLGGGDLDADVQKQLAKTPMTDEAKRKKLLEELESLKFIKLQTMPCPNCKQPINRSAGCNKMKCTLCCTYFCYRCGKDITHEGYAHFGGTSCPTFDREEVLRMQARERLGAAGQAEVDAELEDLRRQFPDQEQILANFNWQPLPLAEQLRANQPDRTREKREGDKQCPNCRQWNERTHTLNMKKCHACRASFCFDCGLLLRGRAMDHFAGPNAVCPQHVALAPAAPPGEPPVEGPQEPAAAPEHAAAAAPAAAPAAKAKAKAKARRRPQRAAGAGDEDWAIDWADDYDDHAALSKVGRGGHW